MTYKPKREGGTARRKFGCRLNDLEIKALMKKVKASKMNVAEYIRNRILS
jgi:hypothetical protein